MRGVSRAVPVTGTRPLVTTLHEDDMLDVSSELEAPRCAQLMHVD